MARANKQAHRVIRSTVSPLQEQCRSPKHDIRNKHEFSKQNRFQNLDFRFVSSWSETDATPDIRISDLEKTRLRIIMRILHPACALLPVSWKARIPAGRWIDGMGLDMSGPVFSVFRT